ncbi:MAG: rhodanese-like domain-containing protein [Elusimicrobia bacterium]|nr:rhodanese-like domain-containing protein [Elusimicrobiota bacterium]
MFYLKRIVLILFSIFLATASIYSAENKVVQEKTFIVDVCTSWEFRQKHYPGAINIPVDEIEGRLEEFGNKKRPIIVYCAGGVRSEEALEILKENGFKNVKNGGSLDEMLKKKKIK